MSRLASSAPRAPCVLHQEATVLCDAGAGSSFTLQIEDVFTITGRGTVVTGRVARGEVRTGQTVALLREGHLLAHVRVDGIEAFREQRTTASAGDLVGLVLSGVTRADLARGDVVTAAGGSAQDGSFSAASS